MDKTSTATERVLVLEAGHSERHYWRDLWAYRELFLILAWRDVAVRYKQTVIGVAWAVIRPFLTMVIFTVVFGRIAKLPSEGAAPYPLMVFAGMLPWFLFSTVLGESSNSLIANSSLIGKVYFPRLIIPVSSALVAVIDFAINLVLLAAMMAWFGYCPDWRIIFMPPLVVLGLAVSIGPALLLAALNVTYRDFRYVIPFILQFGLYLSPVGFSSAVVPPAWRFWYSLNPMVGVIDGFRWSVLGGTSPIYLPGFVVSLVVTAILLWLGLAYFRRTEKLFADLILMAGDVIIRAENLGKKYLIRHDLDRNAHVVAYTALREVLARRAGQAVQGAKQLLRGERAAPSGATEEFWALRDLDFEVRRGEVLGVIGRNGAGKSTLLKVLSRITEPSEGRVTIKGRVASLLEVGTGFHPELTGRENIYLNGAVLGMTRAEVRRRFDEIVDFADIEKFLDTPVKRFSSGMYVRLAFAVAAFLEQDILVIDEVLAVGDIEFQKKCLGKMSDVAYGGRTILFVSHNMGSVASLCRNAILLRNGRIVTSGAARDVIDSYLAASTAATLASFEPRPGQPSITGVRLDEEGLRRGNLVVSVDFVSPFPLRPPIVGIVVYNQSGNPVWGSNGRFHPSDQTDLAVSAGTVICEAKALPLAPSSYRLSVWLADWHMDYEERANVLSFDFRIEASGALRQPAAVMGNLDWAPTWRVVDLPRTDGELARASAQIQ